MPVITGITTGKLLAWVGIPVSFFIGLFGWVARNQVKRVDEVVEQQQTMRVSFAKIETKMDNIVGDTSELKTDLKNGFKDISDILNSNHAEQIRKLEIENKELKLLRDK